MRDITTEEVIEQLENLKSYCIKKGPKEARQLKLGPKENITFFHYTSI